MTPKNAEKAAVRKRIDECKKKIQQDAEFKLIEVSQNGDTSAEYSTIADKVIKYIQPGHNWLPNISKIERIQNPKLELKFEEARVKCNGTHTDQVSVF